MKHRLGAIAVAITLMANGLGAAGQASGIKGTTTSQKGTVRLAGVAVTILDAQNRQVAALESGHEGQIPEQHIPPGRYTVVAKLAGFREIRRVVEILPRAIADVQLDLDAGASDTVSVVVTENEDALSRFASSMASREVVSGVTAERLPVGGESIQAALRLISSVTEQTGGLRIKGGRTDQSSLQFGRVFLNDPTGANSAFRLPVDAMNSIEVLPNPYAAEYGGFSSGLMVVHSRTPSDKWTFMPNGWPAFLTTRRNPFHPVALREYTPRFVVAGPIKPGKLSVLVSALARYRSEQVWSRPLRDRKNTIEGSLFTRLDARPAERHLVTATLGYFPGTTKGLDLGTFIPPESTLKLKQQTLSFGLGEAFQIRPTTKLETTFAVGHFLTRTSGQGVDTMVVAPDEMSGDFFNDQDRRATTWQLSQSLSAVRQGFLGAHILKAGFDLLRTGYRETSTNRPIEVRRADGTLASVLSFDAASVRRSTTMDAAAYVQDWWQVHERLLIEAGLRVERNDAFDETVVAPRAAATVALNAAGTAALRAGIGLFPDRIPQAVDAFDQLGAQTETRFAADGVTPLGPSVAYAHTIAPDLRTPRSLTWNVEFDQRITRRLSVRVNYLDRRGSNELIVQPFSDGSTGELQLSSRGQSEYREAEVAVRYIRENVIDVAASYTRSHSTANLNSYNSFYALKRNPFIRPDAYALTDVHAPNRLLVWTTLTAIPDWLIGVVGSVRNGFPFSAVNEYLDFVGPRNEGHVFPTSVSLDVSVEWHVKFEKLARKLGRLGRLRPWVGFTLFNALDSRLPTEVQANTGSASFGSFYNSPMRQFRISLRFRR